MNFVKSICIFGKYSILPTGNPLIENHGIIHDDERNHKVYIPTEIEVQSNDIPNRRKLLRKANDFWGNTYFKQISK